MIQKYFMGSLLFTAIALALSGVVGHVYGGGAMIVTYLISACLLAVLEVAVSLDNAVVNAGVLKDMDQVWRKRFLTWGMAIAVFGMRLVFPVAIVAIAGGIGPIEAINLGLFKPAEYQALLKSVNTQDNFQQHNCQYHLYS